MTSIVMGIVDILIAVLWLVLSIMHFMGKGPLLNNEYLYSSKSGQDGMEKGSYFRQSAIVFLLVAFIFLFMGLRLLVKLIIFSILTWILVAVVLIYAIVSTKKIKNNGR